MKLPIPIALIALIPAALIPTALFGAGDSRPSIDVWGAKTALSFEPNRGQSNPRARYLVRASKGLILFTDRSIVLPGKAGAVVFQFAGGAIGRWEASDPTGAKTSYFVGRDESKWARDVE